MPKEKSGSLLLSPWELLDLSLRPARTSTADRGLRPVALENEAGAEDVEGEVGALEGNTKLGRGAGP
jgi:hypothetical protein